MEITWYLLLFAKSISYIFVIPSRNTSFFVFSAPAPETGFLFFLGGVALT